MPGTGDAASARRANPLIASTWPRKSGSDRSGLPPSMRWESHRLRDRVRAICAPVGRRLSRISRTPPECRHSAIMLYHRGSAPRAGRRSRPSRFRIPVAVSREEPCKRAAFRDNSKQRAQTRKRDDLAGRDMLGVPDASRTLRRRESACRLTPFDYALQLPAAKSGRVRAISRLDFGTAGLGARCTGRCAGTPLPSAPCESCLLPSPCC